MFAFPKHAAHHLHAAPGSCMKARGMTDKEEWVIWNGSLGILDMATVGDIRDGEGGRRASLAPPYDVVGPFSLDELEARGRIAFGECLVMSRRRWQEDQVGLRLEARVPLEGALKPSEINAAFRRLAKTAHPDAGGSDEHYRRIAEARDALLKQFESAS